MVYRKRDRRITGLGIVASFFIFGFFPALALAGSQTFTTSGTFTVPSYSTLTVQVWGAGASGGGTSNYTAGVAGNSGGQSSFNGTVIGGGGIAPGTALPGGAGGTASGGDINTAGGAGGAGWTDLAPCPTSGAGGASPSGGAGGAGVGNNLSGNPGSVPGGAGSGGSSITYVSQQQTYYCRAEPGGGGGAYSAKTYSPGALTPGSGIAVVVGSGGAAPSALRPGGAGANGQVTITWTDPPPTLQCSGTPEIYSTPGTYTRTIPTYSSMQAEVWGGGGGGGGLSGGGGGGAGYASKTYTSGALTPGSTVSIVVGTGGNGFNGTNSAGGGTSSFNTTVSATGGGRGKDWTHDRSFAGGAGGTGSGGDTNSTGAAGTTGTGSSVNPGGAAANGGAGGAGGTTVSGSDGGLPGGGGGGGGNGSPAYGGNGASGEVKITCSQVVAPTCTLTPSSQTITAGNSATLNYTISGSATSASINGVSVATSASGSYSPSPSSTTSYTMTVSNSGGSNTCGPASVTVNIPPAVPMTGYAWSDTIGWIDLNCSNSNVCGTNNFGFSVAWNGDMSGYAWSDSIGWISANQSDLTSCPSGECKAKVASNNMQGWVKALSADGHGWDGWISLNGSSPQYGVTQNPDSTLTGYAWGSDVVGWVDFSRARIGYPVCTPAYTCSGQTIQYTNNTCQVSNVTTCVSPYFCSAGSSTCLVPTPQFNAFSSGGTALTGHLQVIPSLVPKNTAVKLFWNVSNVSSCSVSGSNNDSWTGISSGTSGATSSPIVQQTVFTLACIKLDNSSFSEKQTVNLVPVFQEK